MNKWMNQLIKYWHDVNTGLYEIIVIITFISRLQFTIYSFIFFIHLFESGNYRPIGRSEVRNRGNGYRVEVCGSTRTSGYSRPDPWVWVGYG